ncbi:MAG: hypothetical protein K0S39_943 [Paenibacillus sp.]|jgi:hypothetical protein|nr:hypothetical protein [Paenibacillus sp.]
MLAVSHSPGLHHAVRSLSKLNSEELLNIFKDAKWFDSYSLSAAEGQAVMKQFSKSTKNYIQSIKAIDSWQ